MNISTIFVHVEECALRDNIYLFTCWIIHEYCAQTVLYQTVWILFFHGEFSVDAFWIWILLTTFNAIWFSSLERTLIWTNAMMLHYSRLRNLAVNPIQIASSMNALLWCLFHFHNRLHGTDHFCWQFSTLLCQIHGDKICWWELKHSTSGKNGSQRPKWPFQQKWQSY